MSISQSVNVTAVINNSGIAKQGFGTVGVMAYDVTWPDRKRTYRSLAAAIADGVPSDGATASSISKIFGQSPHGTQVAVLRGTRKPTLQYTVDAVGFHATYPYKMNVKGQGVTPTTALYTSDTSPSEAKINAGLVAQLNAVVDNNYLAAFAASTIAPFAFTADHTTSAGATFTHATHGLTLGEGPFQGTNSGGALPAGFPAVTDLWAIPLTTNTFKLATSLVNALAGTAIVLTGDGTGTQTLTSDAAVKPAAPFTVTGTSAGAWFSLEVLDTSSVTITMTHADPGITADLNEIYNIDKDWYYLVTNFNSVGMILPAAEWIEATPFKIYMVRSSDSVTENTAKDNGDAIDQLTAFGYTRTLPIYHRKPDQCIDAGLAGRLSPLNVGTWTAAYKTVIGAIFDPFSDTQTDNLDSKRCTYYKVEADTPMTWEGKVGNLAYGYLDVTVSLDFVIDDIQKSAFSVMKALDKVSYTDEDIALIQGAIEGAVARAVSPAHKIAAPGTPGSETDPPPSVVFPRVADIDPTVRALRNVPDAAVNFRLQGAVHSVNVNLTVSF